MIAVTTEQLREAGEHMDALQTELLGPDPQALHRELASEIIRDLREDVLELIREHCGVILDGAEKVADMLLATVKCHAEVTIREELDTWLHGDPSNGKVKGAIRRYDRAVHLLAEIIAEVREEARREARR